MTLLDYFHRRSSWKNGWHSVRVQKKTDGQNIHDYLENMEYDPIDNIR
jgi:hypothetical protein